ncbi:collagen-like protein [Actinomyces johnsonii]|uniref:collagen-like protein n=1 Tax=Actinomyces johnsonii TaxID=544581 RepID=UPI0028D58F47|nr:collagen-like protein [Actinomyces johnsonii]
MTQPPNPGQPFYQQQPSAPSAPATGQPYPPQQQFQGVPGAPGAPAAPGAPGQPFPPAPVGDSFVGNLLDTAKPFAEKFGKMFFYIAAGALIISWVYSASITGVDHGYSTTFGGSWNFNAGRFFADLVFNAPWTIVQIGLVRLFLELVINSGKNGQQA